MVIVHPEWRGSRTNPTCLTWYVKKQWSKANSINSASTRNILACITDITIACILAHHLVSWRFYPELPLTSPHFVQLKRRTGHPESDRLLVKVAKCMFISLSSQKFCSAYTFGAVTVQTGICTAAWAMLTLILFVSFQYTIHLASY